MSAPVKAVSEEGALPSKHPLPGKHQMVDPRAVVSEEALLGPGVKVGPFAVIGKAVELGEESVVHPHAVIEGPARLGPRNEIHPFACIGGSPQDLRHQGEPTELIIGEGNVFREHVTVNRGTTHGGGATVIGDQNLFMAYTHVAHDCEVGSHVVMANHAAVAGHAVVEDYAVFGGMVGVGTFLRIGESAMLAAGAMVEREVPPFCIVAGDRARLRAVNRVGLARRSISQEARREIKEIFRALKESSRSVSEIVESYKARGSLAPDETEKGEVTGWTLKPLTEEAMRMLTFLEKVTRGLTR